jgi:hypothetical protein
MGRLAVTVKASRRQQVPDKHLFVSKVKGSANAVQQRPPGRDQTITVLARRTPRTATMDMCLIAVFGIVLWLVFRDEADRVSFAGRRFPRSRPARRRRAP